MEKEAIEFQKNNYTGRKIQDLNRMEIVLAAIQLQLAMKCRRKNN